MKEPLTSERIGPEMKRLENARAEAESASALATLLFWAAVWAANAVVLVDHDPSDVATVLSIALICEGTIYLALWAFMRGVCWATTEPSTPAVGLRL